MGKFGTASARWRPRVTWPRPRPFGFDHAHGGSSLPSPRTSTTFDRERRAEPSFRQPVAIAVCPARVCCVGGPTGRAGGFTRVPAVVLANRIELIT
jgi:hypothetical protein